MEQASNTFTGGLQMDTNPMMLSSDTLTDALNATVITMNGNEVVLLNDMGNRRIDNAYLPSGYQPVGMKEYGGIIYIAAYNPITNRSQIGSFPSPERKIGPSDEELGGKLNLDDLFNNTTEIAYLNSLKCLKSDSQLISLTNDTSLHTGDKFVVYGELIDQIKDKVTNYSNTVVEILSDLNQKEKESDEDYYTRINNIYFHLIQEEEETNEEFYKRIKSNLNNQNTKIYSPKNKQYTLALGILNSQHEFFDITPSLVRWNNSSKLIENLDEKSDLYKFNSGYFIAKSYDNSTLSVSLNDASLLQERQVIEANTYAYKLAGPLYLKATLNHILNFSYNIYGKTTNNDKTEADIWIEGVVTYNCPDGVSSFNDSTNNTYYTFEEGEPTFEVFDFYKITEDGLLKESTEVELLSTNFSKTTYDPETDLYTCTITKKYHIQAQDGIFNYVIGVKASNDKDIYLSGLSDKGVLDFSLFGSGLIDITGWRFYNNLSTETFQLTYSLNAYPEYGKKFEGLYFIFENVNLADKESIKIWKTEINNGKSSVYIPKNLLKKRKLYNVYPLYFILEKQEEFSSKILITNSDIYIKVTKLEEFEESGKYLIVYNDELIFNGYNTNGVSLSKNITSKEENIIAITDLSEGALITSFNEISNTKVSIDITSKGSPIIDKDGKRFNYSNVSKHWAFDKNISTPIYLYKKINFRDVKNKKWFLTTELFNDCYLPSSDKFIVDYSSPIGSEEEIREQKLKVQANITIDPKVTIDNLTTTLEGSHISKTSDINVKFNTSRTVTIQLNRKALLKENLYPDYIYLGDQEFSQLLKTQSDFSNLIDYINKSKEGSSYEDVANISRNQSSNSDTVILQINNEDILRCEGVSDDTRITNGFVNFLNIDLTEYIGIGAVIINWTGISGGDDYHRLMVNYGNSQVRINGDSQYKHEGRVEFTAFQYNSQICGLFNSLPSNKIFLWGGYGEKDWWRYALNTLFSTSIADLNYDMANLNITRFWWRGEGRWSLFSQCKRNFATPTNFIRSLVGNKVFAYYLLTTFNEAGLYKPSFDGKCRYNLLYSIDYPIELEIGYNQLLLTNRESSFPIRFSLLESKLNFNDSIQLNSSEEFLNLIDQLKNNSLEYKNIYLENGATLDYDGNELLSKFVYDKDLKIINNNYITPVDVGNSKLMLTYTRTNSQGLEFQYDCGMPNVLDKGGKKDSWTAYNYLGTNIVKLD